MNNLNPAIDNWLTTVDFDDNQDNDIWDPGFNADRQVVFSKFGGFKKLFLRPDKFIKRFYHTVYPLPIEEWQCDDQVQLYDGFCSMDIKLNVRFQATFRYAQSNMEILAELNEHIKQAYYSLVIDIVSRELLNLSDGGWVQQGMEPVEKRICTKINEMLILQNIQAQTSCQLTPSFEEFPNVQFAKESVYLCVLKRNYEFNEQHREELFRQQQEKDKQTIEQKRKQLQQLNEIAKIDRERQAVQTENTKKQLKEKENQQKELFEIKKRLHADKVKNNNLLKRMTLLSELDAKKVYQEKVRQQESIDKIEELEHEAQLKEKELDAKIVEYEKEQASWREAKNKIHAQELDLKQQQKQLEFDTEVGAKQRFEARRIAMQEESFSTRKKADVYLKREIELLKLEKQRMALQLEIKQTKEQYKQYEQLNEPKDE